MENFRTDSEICPICGSKNWKIKRRLKDHLSGEGFWLAECFSCSGGFISNPPTPAQLSHYYQTSGGVLMHSKPGRLFELARKFFIRRGLERISRISNIERLADIGCGDGSFLEVAGGLGINVFGVDIYPEANWKNKRIDYFQFEPGASIGEIVLRASNFDAVNLRHVLEHLPNPLDYFVSLKEAGVRTVLVTVPNFNSIFRRLFPDSWYYLDPPRHLIFFNKRSLAVLGKQSGFQIQSIKREGLDEIITSFHRKLLLLQLSQPFFRLAFFRTLVILTRPTGLLAGLSTLISKFASSAALSIVFTNVKSSS